MRPKHHNKSIEQAIKKAELKGWRYQKAGNSSHAWGRLLCPLESRDGCKISIWSTPRNQEDYAKQIMRSINACDHQGEQND